MVMLILIASYNIILIMNINDVTHQNAYRVFLDINNPGRNLMQFVILALLLPSISLTDTFDKSYNKFDTLIISRIGYNKYYMREYINTFFKSMVFMLILHVIILLNIYLLYPVEFRVTTGMTASTSLFVENSEFLNVLIFISLSCIGTGVFMCSLLPLTHIIKNRYIFQIIIIAITFLSLMIYSYVSTNFWNLQDVDLLCIGGFFIPINIMLPGMVQESQGFLCYIPSLIFYSLLLVLGFLPLIKARENYD